MANGKVKGAIDTYGTVQHVLSLVAALLDVTLECTGVERLEKFEAAEELRRH